MTIKNKINLIILKLTGFMLVKQFPKPSIRFAKEYFKNKKIDAIEIGTWEGKNAKDILDNLNINEIYLIDPWIEYEDYREWKNPHPQKELDGAYQKTKRLLKSYQNKIIYLKNFASKVIDKVPVVDYIYIDGNHTYKYVLEDCENYWGKVKDGGVMAGHDIDLKEVAKAVQEFCNKRNLIFQVNGMDWWIVKKKKSNLGEVR